jgi:hypothetical protein
MSALSESHRNYLINAGLKPEAIEAQGYHSVMTGDGDTIRFPIHNTLGEVIGYQDRPDTPGKDKSGRALKYVTPFGQPNHIDVPVAARDAVLNPSAPLLITEGNKKAVLATQAGYATVALAGVWCWVGRDDNNSSLTIPDWRDIPLAARKVAIAFDPDIMRKPQVRHAANELADWLRHTKKAVVSFVVLPESEGINGLDDWLLANPEGDPWSYEVAALPDSATKQKREMLEDMIELHFNAVQDVSGTLCGFAKQGNHRNFVISGEQMVNRVAKKHRPQIRSGALAVTDAAKRQMTTVLLGESEDIPRVDPHLRSQYVDGKIYVDLGDETRAIVEIGPDGWKVCDAAPAHVLFKRGNNMQPLPVPERGGNLDALRELLGFEAESQNWYVVLGWLTAVWFDEYARPLLLWLGAPGSGKSTRALQVLDLVDPRPQMTAYREKMADSGVIAGGSYLIGWDNLTKVTEGQSNWLCSMVTGAQDEVRQFYSNTGVVTITYKRTGMLTAINQPHGLAADALDRVLSVNCDALSHGRRGASELMSSLIEQRPAILGALFDHLAGTLARMPDVGHISDRMTDYVRVLTAADPVLATAYREAVAVTMEEAAHEPWIDSLLAAVRQHNGEEAIAETWFVWAFSEWRGVDDTYRPRSGKAMMSQINKSSGPLAARGLTVQRRKSNGDRLVQMTWVGAPPADPPDGPF